MHSTVNPPLSDDPHDFVVVPPDAVRVVPSDDELSDVLRDAARRLGDPQAHAGPGLPVAIPPVDTSFRATAVANLVAADRWPIGDWALRGVTAFAFAACTCAAGVAWQFYGGPAKQVIAEWTPLALTSSPPAQDPGQDAPPAAAPIEAAAADAAAPQPAPPTLTAAEVAAAAVAPATDPSARELASARTEIEQLKANIAELKASQQQMSRDLAKASQAKAAQNQRPRIPAPSPHIAAARPHNPPMPYPPLQAAAAPAYPPAAAPYAPPLPQYTAPPPSDREISPVPRPPMPVR
jgi:hypothetical protein